MTTQTGPGASVPYIEEPFTIEINNHGLWIGRGTVNSSSGFDLSDLCFQREGLLVSDDISEYGVAQSPSTPVKSRLDLGAHGALPTGTAPMGIIRAIKTPFQPNRGTSAIATLQNGVFEDAVTSPSDLFIQWQAAALLAGKVFSLSASASILGAVTQWDATASFAGSGRAEFGR